MKKIIEIKGMTCGECSRHVAIELGKIKGVTKVNVDLAEGVANLELEHPINLTKVAYILDDIGYSLGRTIK
jgi:copper chaperone CopZ